MKTKRKRSKDPGRAPHPPHESSPAEEQGREPEPASPEPDLPEAGVAESPKDSEFWPQFEVLRVLALLGVFFSHVVPASPDTVASLGENMRTASDHWAMIVYRLGWSGVEFFFVLTAFLATLKLCRERQRSGDIDIQSFVKRRLKRIGPLYYCTLLFGFIIWPHSNLSSNWHDDFGHTTRQFIGYCLFLGNFVAAADGGPTTFYNEAVLLWPLCIAAQYYLGWAWAMKKIRGITPLLKILGALELFTLLVRAGLIHSETYFTWYMQSFSHLDGLVVGSALGLLYGEGEAGTRWRGITAWLAPLATLAVFGPLARVIDITQPALPQTLSVIILALYFGLVIAWVLAHPQCFRFRGRLQWIVGLGASTYAMYCFQDFCLEAVDYLGKGPTEFLPPMFSYVSAATLALCLNFLLAKSWAWTVEETWA